MVIRTALFFGFLLCFVGGCSSQSEQFEREKMLQEEILIRQKMELERQEREHEDIRRQEYHNKTLEPYR